MDVIKKFIELPRNMGTTLRIPVPPVINFSTEYDFKNPPTVFCLVYKLKDRTVDKFIYEFMGAENA